MVEFTQLVQALDASPDEDARLHVAVSSAVSLSGCDHAGYTTNEEGGLLTRLSSDDIVRRADHLQNELTEGPCLDVMRDHDVVVSDDLAQEKRWPLWASRVRAELGVESMMSLLVHTGRRSYGALSLYAEESHRFDLDAVAVGQALAAHLAVTIAAGREIGQLKIAVHSRTIIGQAQGILMERLDIDADRAFEYLRRASSVSNRRLSMVALDITRTRQLCIAPPTVGRAASRLEDVVVGPGASAHLSGSDACGGGLS
jgi:GAF domain-containing protein